MFFCSLLRIYAGQTGDNIESLSRNFAVLTLFVGENSTDGYDK